MDMDFGVRVGVVIERSGALLLVRHEKPDRDPYWVLPGGRLELGETIPACAEREVAEEVGLDAGFLEVLYISEFFQEDRHTVDITVKVEVPAGQEPELGSDPEVEPGAETTLKDLRWVRIEELGEINLLPGWVRDRLSSDAARGWPRGDIYLKGSDDH